MSVVRNYAASASANSLPVGAALSFPAQSFGAPVSGATSPEIGASGGAFYNYDKASTETAMFAIFGLVPRNWLTVDLYIEAWNLTGGAGDVVWRTNYNSAGNVDTTVSYSSAVQFNFNKVPPSTTFTLQRYTVGTWEKGGGTVLLSRVGGDAADTLDGDISLAALHLVRVT